MNYIILYIRLDSYAKHRAERGNDGEISTEELEKTTNREYYAMVFFTILIFFYPTVIASMLAKYASEYKGGIINQWTHYELFYMFNFIVIAILLTVSTYLTMYHMRKVLGEINLKEEKSMKYLLIIFTSTYIFRVCFSILLYFKEEWVYNVFDHSNTIFCLAVLCLWLIYDAVPITSILLMNYRSWNSFEDEEILYCEYSIDDRRDTTSRQYNLDDRDELDASNLLETSGVINLESSSEVSSSDSEEGLEIGGSSSSDLNGESQQ